MQAGALYIRVSTDDQTEFSPDAQKKLLLDYAKKNGILIDSGHIFMDEGFSGRKAEKRPAFMRMVATAKIKPKPFDVILVHKFDRFARNREDSVVYKSLLKKECDVRVVSITEQLEDDKFSIILESMLEAMAEYYSLNLSEEVTKGMTEKASRGGLQSKASLGYYVKDNQLFIKDDEAEIVRYIYDQFLQGERSTFRMAKQINALGYRTKNGNLFQNRTLKYILRNPVYIGIITWTPGLKKDLDFKHPDTIRIKGSHEPLIDQSQFDQVQEILDAQELNARPKARPSSELRHWLSGLVRCHTCGSVLVYTSSRSPGYQCRKYSSGTCLVSHRIALKKMETIVLNNIEQVLTGSDVTYRTSARPSINVSAESLLQGQLQKMNGKLARAKSAYVDGVDTLEEYKENKASILEEKRKLENSISQEQSLLPFDKMAFKHQLSALHNTLPDPTIGILEKSNLIRGSIEKIIYNKDTEELEIYYYI